MARKAARKRPADTTDMRIAHLGHPLYAASPGIERSDIGLLGCVVCRSQTADQVRLVAQYHCNCRLLTCTVLHSDSLILTTTVKNERLPELRIGNSRCKRLETVGCPVDD